MTGTIKKTTNHQPVLLMPFDHSYLKKRRVLLSSPAGNWAGLWPPCWAPPTSCLLAGLDEHLITVSSLQAGTAARAWPQQWTVDSDAGPPGTLGIFSFLSSLLLLRGGCISSHLPRTVSVVGSEGPSEPGRQVCSGLRTLTSGEPSSRRGFSGLPLCSRQPKGVVAWMGAKPTRSFGGWGRERLGAPSQAWKLQGQVKGSTCEGHSSVFQGGMGKKQGPPVGSDEHASPACRFPWT